MKLKAAFRSNLLRGDFAANNWQAWLAIALLATAGYLGNATSFPIFWGVDFLFGSIATLLVGCFYGPLAGTLAALVASSYTYQLWGHPYAIVIFTVEVAAVSWAYQRWRLNLVLLDALYWLLPGPLLTVGFYSGIMGFATVPTAVIALKQAVNGLFNALIASALLLLVNYLGRLLARDRHAPRPHLALQAILSDLLVAAVFLPTLLLVAAGTSGAVADIEASAANRLQATAGELSARLELWQEQALAALDTAAQQVATRDTETAVLLTTVVESAPAIDGLALLNSDGAPRATVGTVPQLAAVDWPDVTAGAPPQWWAGRDRDRPEAVQLAAIAALPNGERLVAQFNLGRLQTWLNAALADTERAAVVLAEDQRAIASTLDEVALLEPFALAQLGVPQAASGAEAAQFWQVLPANAQLPLVVRYRESAYWLRRDLDERFLATVWVSLPAAAAIVGLQLTYVYRLAQIWAIALLALLLATAISRRLSRPLQELASLSADLPTQIGRGHNVSWPQSIVAEFDALARNFQEMALSLAARFYQIEQAKAQLEERVADRTSALSAANADLEAALVQLQTMQTQLVQTEKMSSLGNLVAGVAHEINNPVNFIHGNLFHIENYVGDLLAIIAAYQQHAPLPPEVAELIADLELDFIAEDCPKSLQSMRSGTTRIREIVNSLRNFSRIDEAEFKSVDLHEGLDSTLMILHNRLKPRLDWSGIEVVKQYGDLPLVECYAGHVNQVFMNILVNAIDALEERDRQRSLADQAANPSQIAIATEVLGDRRVRIRIVDNGPGIPEAVQSRLFDPFFTTKTVGKGTGLGMSISRQIIVEQHGGAIACHSQPGEGAEFALELPQRLQVAAS